MVSKNNVQVKDRYSTKQVPHYGIRKLSVGVASILLGTTFYMGMNGNVVHADTVNGQDSETPGSQVANSDSNSGSTANSDSNVDKAVFGDKQAVGSSAEASVNNEVNVKPQVTEITNDSHVQSATNAAKSDVDANAQSDAANVKSDTKTPSNEMASAVATETSPALMSSSASSSSQGAATAPAPVEGDASNKANSQVQPSSVTGTTQTKLSHHPVMRLAAATTTNSDELIVGKDVTISDFSVTVAEGKNEFENAHANIKFTMHADDPLALAGKRLTIQVDTKVWDGFYSSEQQNSNPATISYQGHVIGTLSYGYPFYFVYITFNNDVKNYTKIDVQSDLVVAGGSQHAIPYRTSLYTPTQAKDGQTYYLTNDVTIGQQKYSSNLPSVIHYYALDSEFVSSATDVTTTSYAQRDSELYAGTFYKTPNGIYYSQSSIYGSNNLYDSEQGQLGYLSQPYLYVGTDIITDHTQSYTATFDIDQTKLSPDQDLKFTPITSYSLDKDYWDDENLLPNTRDVYVDDSQTYSTTVTADATVIKNGVIFNKLNGQSLATRIVNAEGTNSHFIFSRNTNYIDYDGKLYLTPALFKQLQAVAESDQNLTEAINTVKTTGMNAEIKLAKPIDTGLKATIKTSDGKTKEVPLLIDTIDYVITTASTVPKGAMLVAAQGKTAKVYHHGDQNIPAVVDQNKLTKTITRTINVHEPGKKVTTIKQDVVMTQSVSVVDGKDVTYNGDWKVQGDSQWASYDVPSVPGYTASQFSVAQQTVTDATQDQTIDITYTANEHQISIEYVDNATGHVVKTDHVSGKTGQTVSITPDIPDGWELVSGQSVPSEVTVGADGAPTTVIKVQPQERSVAIKFVDDQSFNQQVGQAITLTGRDGDTVDLKLTIPDKYQLADGQQLPTTYTFTAGSGNVTIHLVHKVVQREAAVNVQLMIMTEVHFGNNGYDALAIPQTRWEQLDDELKDGLGGPGGMYNAMPLIEVGTLTGHVNYDLVDNEVLSFGNDWTSLNLDGHTYQLPNGDDVVNGITFDPETASGKKLKEEILKTYQVTHTDVDSDYVNRPWHGYLSVNATNNSDTYIHQLGLQTGLVGNEPNALAKATDDRAATSVEMSNKPIDLNFVQTYDVEFSEQDGQLRAKVDLPVGGVYVPYVEKTAATRTINVTTPDGKTTAVKQTATLTKQIDLGKDAHQDWTTGEWENYEVPAIPGYTASQSNVSKETVTGTTEDQTVNITYTANEHQISVEYVDNATGKILKTDHVSGKTGQTVSITPDIPDGWELVSGQSVPSEVTVGADGAPTTVIKVQPQERSVTVKFVDDQSYDFDTSDHKAQVGQAITVTGRDGDTVDLKLTIPDKYQLADGQQLPTTYTFAKGSGDLKIHLVHKVVQLKATVDVKLNLLTAVSIYSNHERPLTVTQDQWKQMEAKAEDVDSLDALTPSVKAGTLTGHVNYDLVYGNVVSFGDDWTSLNLGGQTYQLPNGDEVVNGVMAFSADYPWGKTLKEFFLKDNTNTDSDYANRPWHGYLSVNATNNAEDIRRIGLQAGLVGDEFNALAKATGDRAATGIEMANTTIDLSWLQRHVGLSLPKINEQDGQVKYHTSVDAAGVYIPYVEKTATRTINVITPDGKTTTVKQTATLAKQVDLGKDAHPAWTTGEWASYDVPTIPGYTASQSNVAKETVTGTTEDQTINITYTANPQKIHINYVDAQRKLIHTTTVNGQTDQTVKVPNEVPDGWILYSGQNIPKSITFQAANNDRDYVVKHVQSFVLSTAPKEAGTIIEGTKAKTYPAGVSDADLNKTITRTILVKDANGRTVNTKTQTVHFVRNAVVDAVTGHVEYLGWSEDGSHIFATYVPVPKNGYTINSAKTVTVTPNDTDSTVELTYKTIPKTITVEYMTTDGKQIASQNVKADDNNQVKFTAPDGYVLATNTNTVDVSDLNDNIYRVLVRANEQTYTAGSTNIPKNVKNLTKVVTRTIVIVMPNGHKRTIKQRVTFERTATVKSDGSVVYTDYQPVGHDAFNHIFIAHRFGYNLNFSDGSKNVTRVDHVTADTPDQTIVVTYVRKNAN